MAADGVQNFPAAIAAAEQQGFLARAVKEGLDSNLAWRRLATRQMIPAGIGATYTWTRKGRLTPITTPSTPQASMSLDLGLTPAQYAIEQMTLTLADFMSASGDLDSVQNQVGIFDQMLAISRNSGVQAAQSKERLARNALYGAYLSGNSRVRVDLGASSTTTCHVDDVRGFQFQMVNGVPTAVSGGNPMTVQETADTGAGAVTQTLTVTGVAVDGSNASTLASSGGISGVLTFNAATAPVHGDQLVAAAAPTIVRPNGRLSTTDLTGGDLITLQTLLDAKLVLENNGIPPFEDGNYGLVCGATSVRQMFSDQDFKILFSGRGFGTQETREGFVLDLYGIRIMPTTEVIIQNPSTNTANGKTDQVNVKVQRPMLVGAEALIEGVFQGLENYTRSLNSQPNTVLAHQFDDTVQIIRYPIDRGGRWYSFAWDWIGGYCAPTDLTANANIIPTANSSQYKRGVVIEHASS